MLGASQFDVKTSEQTLGSHASRLADAFERSDWPKQTAARAHRDRVAACTLTLCSLAQPHERQLLEPSLEADVERESCATLPLHARLRLGKRSHRSKWTGRVHSAHRAEPHLPSRYTGPNSQLTQAGRATETIETFVIVRRTFRA
jgi:hypothetical protein